MTAIGSNYLSFAAGAGEAPGICDGLLQGYWRARWVDLGKTEIGEALFWKAPTAEQLAGTGVKLKHYKRPAAEVWLGAWPVSICS